jgi:hypothetical protein
VDTKPSRHMKSIVMVIHNNSCVEVTRGRFTDKGIDIDMTRLESGMSFLQVKSSMTMEEVLFVSTKGILPICAWKQQLEQTTFIA